MVDPSNSDWKLALDLLIARAALDTELASQLTIDAKACCEQNGINLPDRVQLVISNPDKACEHPGVTQHTLTYMTPLTTDIKLILSNPD